MKIDARGLPDFLKQPTRYRAILLYGPDEGLIRERRKLIVQKAGGDSGFGATELTAESVLADPPRLYEALSAMSLLGDAPPVVLREAGDRMTPIMKQAATLPEGTNLLVVTAGELISTSSLRQFFEKNAQLAAIACYNDEAQTVEQVARTFLAKHQIRADPETLAYLRAHLGNDRAVTLSELEKIVLYLGDEKDLTPAILETLTGDNRTVMSDDLCRAILSGETRRVHQLTDRLMEEGESPVALLRALSRQVERVLQLRMLIDGGLAADRAMAALRPPVFFKEKDAMRRHAARHDAAALRAMLTRVTLAELAVKQSGETTLAFRHRLATL